MIEVPIWIGAVARSHVPEDHKGDKDEAMIDRIALSMAAMQRGCCSFPDPDRGVSLEALGGVETRLGCSPEEEEWDDVPFGG